MRLLGDGTPGQLAVVRMQSLVRGGAARRAVRQSRAATKLARWVRAVWHWRRWRDGLAKAQVAIAKHMRGELVSGVSGVSECVRAWVLRACVR